jgi:hypothetical protein
MFLRSSFDISRQWQVDGALRYVSRLNTMQVPDYAEMDLKVNWKPPQVRNLDVSLVGQNLLQSRHVEFGNPAQQVEIQRGIYGELAWHF